MINRFFIITLMLFISNAGFAGNYQTALLSPWNNSYFSQSQLKNWEKETIESAKENKEPSYLLTITESLQHKIANFSKKKKQLLNGVRDLDMHAYSLLFIMNAYQTTALDAANRAVRDVANDAARGHPWGRNRIYAWRAVGEAAWSDAAIAASNAASSVAQGTEHVTLDATENAGKDAYDAAKDAINSAIEQSESRDPSFPERFTYRLAEKIALLHFLDNFDEIVSASYEESIQKMGTAPQDSIFETQLKWNDFKTRHFSKIENDRKIYHFLEPWVKELDLTGKKIKTLRQIERLEQIEQDHCPICLDEIKNKQEVAIFEGCKCKSYYHGKCIQQWPIESNKSRCPICWQESNFSIFKVIKKNNTTTFKAKK